MNTVIILIATNLGKNNHFFILRLTYQIFQMFFFEISKWLRHRLVTVYINVIQCDKQSQISPFLFKSPCIFSSIWLMSPKMDIFILFKYLSLIVLKC